MPSETDEQVEHHAEILMWHATGADDFQCIAQDYAEFFRKYVPDSGSPETVKGRLIRKRNDSMLVRWRRI